MFWLTDFLLIIIATYILFNVIKSIISRGNTSLNYFTIILVYIFCVLPIVFNYIIGIPEYKTLYWYQPFISAMENQTVTIIYDLYILSSVVTLYYAGRRYIEKSVEFDFNEDQMPKYNSKGLWFLIFILPFLYILITGNISSFLYYGSLPQRGITGTTNTVLNSLILTSIYAIGRLVFSDFFTKKKFFFLAAASFLLAWIQGKRFIIAEMILIYLYFYLRTEKRLEIRKKLWLIIPLIAGGLIAFSIVYLAIIKPLSDMGFISIYDMLRVDYGRDDVIKYVIYQEFILKQSILDYPGQSFLALVFIFVPRAIWTTKPYQHYMYLTASILNIPIYNLPAGTTPSWYEMCICNFGVIGMFIAIISLPLICNAMDKLKTISSKALTLVIIGALLTQCIDVYLIFIIFVIFARLSQMFCLRRHIKVRIGRWRIL